MSESDFNYKKKINKELAIKFTTSGFSFMISLSGTPSAKY